MAIFGIGAYYDGKGDVSKKFIADGVAGPGWDNQTAPELHQFIQSLKVGDIVYIKSFAPNSPDIVVKGIGVVSDAELVVDSKPVRAGRNIKWLCSDQFRIPKPEEKNNVRLNTMYEEFHPKVQAAILEQLFRSINLAKP